MEFIKKNILITGLIVFLIIALGVSLYLTQKQTQLKSKADEGDSAPPQDCSTTGTFYARNSTTGACKTYNNQCIEGGWRNDPTCGPSGGGGGSTGGGSATKTCAQGNCGACATTIISACGNQNVYTGNCDYVTACKNNPTGKYTCRATENPNGCFYSQYDCSLCNASITGGSGSGAGSSGGGTNPSTGSGPVSVGSSSVTKQSDGNWPSIRINTNVNVEGADNSKTVAGVYVIKTANKDSGNGWVAINKFYGTNQPDSFEYQLPNSFSAGSYTYGLFQMDNSSVVALLGVSSAVNYQVAAGGGAPSIPDGSDVADCEIVTVNGQSLTSFPGMVVNDRYRVDMIMRNTKYPDLTTTAWASNYKIKFIGGPSAQAELGITNPEFVVGKTITSGDQLPFTVSLTPKSTGTFPFKWQMYNAQGQPFGGLCQPNFTVFTTLPGGGTPGPTTDPTASPTAGPNTQVQFRVANGDSYELAVAGLDGATWTNFSPTANSTFMLSAVTLTNPQSGKAKFVALQFKKGDSIDNNIIVKSILFLGAPPAITGAVNCEYTADATSTRVIINGQNLGAAGSLSSNSLLAYKIESWDQNKVSALFTGKIQGQFPVKLITDQGQSISSICQVGLTTVNFSLTTLCANVTQQNGGYNTDNVKIKIYKNVPEADVSAPSISQTVRVAGGQVQSFAPSLEANKDYSMLIKAPKSPQKRLDFRTQSGTTDLGTITLRIGDIAPINTPDGDGVVNANDIRELYREWSINKDVATIGDVNGDSRVNSVDYSCIKQNYDASKGNETFAPPVNTGNASNPAGGGGANNPNVISITTKGRVFLDANANKLYDSGETLSPNVTVQLLKVPDSHVVGQSLNSSELAQSNILAQTTTDSSGVFTINFNAVNQNLKLSFYVQASAGTNNSPGQVDGSGTLQSLNNLSTNIQLGGIDIPVPFVGVLNMNISQL